MTQENWEYKGVKLTSKWISGDDSKKFEPCTLAVAMCFTKDGKLLINREPYKTWTLPSVKIQKNKPLDALKELMKEASVSIEKIELMGAVEVTGEKFPKFFQQRYFIIIKKDEKGNKDNKIVTKFIEPSELKEHMIKLGPVGEEALKEALKLI